jgi:hypothetical protein
MASAWVGDTNQRACRVVGESKFSDAIENDDCIAGDVQKANKLIRELSLCDERCAINGSADVSSHDVVDDDWLSGNLNPHCFTRCTTDAEFNCESSAVGAKVNPSTFALGAFVWQCICPRRSADNKWCAIQN